MAQITLTIDDAVVPRVQAALCDGTTVSVANSKAKIIEIIKNITIAYEYRQARLAEDAKVAAAQEAAQSAIAAIASASSSQIVIS
jgi:hypothetical protein